MAKGKKKEDEPADEPETDEEETTEVDTSDEETDEEETDTEETDEEKKTPASMASEEAPSTPKLEASEESKGIPDVRAQLTPCQFRSFVDAAEAVLDEGVITVDGDGLHIRGMDPSQISMISVDASCKPQENVGGVMRALGKPTRAGVNFEALSSMMPAFNFGEDAEYINVTVSYANTKVIVQQGERVVKFPMLDLSLGPQKQPKIEFKNSLRINRKAALEQLKVASAVNSHVRLSGSESMGCQYLTFEAFGDKADTRDMTKVLMTEPACAVYPLQFMRDAIAGMAGDEVTIQLKTNAPICVSGEDGGVRFTYFLAPRIEA